MAAGNEINATGSLVGVNITAGNNINAQASVQGGKLNAANNMTIAGNATKSVLTAGNQLTVQGIATDNQLQATSYAIAQEEGKNTRIAQRDATVSPSTESRNLSDLLGVLATALVEAARAAEVQKQADKGGPK